MCGIACIINSRNDMPGEIIENFTHAVTHRGPDGFGIAKFANSDLIKRLPDNADSFSIALGHRRLSILDLTEAGAQPMSSEDGSVVISYNGEVYNYIEIRKELEKNGVSFTSSCDTEVVLAAYQHWGTDCFRRFNGMWAIVILDMNSKKLIISRDRLGIKPLYFYHKDGMLAFASEIKQILTLPQYSKAPNDDAVIAYLINGYEIPPETFFNDISTFPAANFAEIDLKSDLAQPLKPVPFWQPENIAIEKCSRADAVEKVRNQFRNAVKLRLRSDVPVGSCLSGGLDSSSIFVDMGELEQNMDFAAFSACFDDPNVDETPFMESIIKNTRSKHYKVFPDDRGFSEDFDALLKQHDEPVGSISIYAQYKVMQRAREAGVPVLLDGQGGDELFSGYWPTYFLLLDRYRKNLNIPSLAAHLGGAALPGGNNNLISEAFTIFSEFRKRSNLNFQYEINQSKSAKFAEISSAYSTVRGMTPEEYRIFELVDLRLPRLLKWEDKNSMAFSIESRVPFLDINLIETILSIPCEMNMKSGWTKYLFRKAMSKKLPKNICWRKDKKGFETPQDRWMKYGTLHDNILEWSRKKEHPVSEYITTPFSEIENSVKSKSFDTTSMFRLYCLDRWLEQ